MSSGLTVRDLVDTPALGLTLRAGEGGLDRKIAWTHFSELEDPSVWLDGGELLITLGLRIPQPARGQALYIERLADRGVAGLMLGSQVMLRPESLKVADELGFPVISAPYELPFITVTRMVADAQGDAAQRRLLTHVRIFETLRLRTEDDESVGGLFVRLESLSGYRLHVLTPHAASPLPGLRIPPLDLLEHWKSDRALAEIPGAYAVPIWLGGEVVATLVALEQSEDKSGAGLSAIRHIATIAALELSHLHRDREALRRDGGELLLELFAGTVDQAKVAERLETQGLGAHGGLVLAACRSDQPQTASTIYHRLLDDEIPNLTLDRQILYVAVKLADAERLRVIAVDEGCAVGLSAPWADTTAFALARQQARWALERAEINGRAADFEGEDAAFWLPADLGSLRQLVDEILGPVLAYDAEHNSELLKSLVAYFDNERRLSAAAAILYVHKHTLGYRLKRVEELTGRKLNRVSDVSQLWLATRALQVTRDLAQ